MVARFSLAAAMALWVVSSTSSAAAQKLELRVERQAYAGLPFSVVVVADGFHGNTKPAQPELIIDGAKVRSVGVSRKVSPGIQIIGGRRTRVRRVSYVMRWRVDAATAGTYVIPAITVEQSGKRAATRASRIVVKDIPTTDDMRLALELPQRPMWAGETLPIGLLWYVRKEVADQSLVVPFFDDEERFRIRAPDTEGKDTLAFQVGSGELELPLEQSRVRLDSSEFVRIRFTALVTALQAGSFEIEPSAVVAQLKMGARRRSAFDRRRIALFKALDRKRTLEVKPLPLGGRPPEFAGAIGSSFSIAARASRSVVKLGEPVEITIMVRSNQRLEGLRLPNFGNARTLDPRKFAVPDEAPVGELEGEDGTSKKFVLVVQIKDPTVRQIPELTFAFFDPEKGEYQTVRSEAIAMQVDGAAIVNAGDVVSSQTGDGGENGANDPTAASASPVRGLDLGLSSAGQTLRTPMSVSDVRPFLWILYLFPLALLFGRVLWLRRRASHSVDAELRRANAVLLSALAGAAGVPAREAVGAISMALRALARAAGADLSALIERIENAAFAPSAADAPLSAELRDEIETAAVAISSAPATPTTSATALTTVLLLAAISGQASAQSSASRLSEARAAYQHAMQPAERDLRSARFASAAKLYEALAADQDSPELMTDWGNAALGASDRGNAVLAYRRALQLDPGLIRARGNLEWTRDQMPSWLPQASDAGAVDSLFFWHRSMTLARRHLLGALGFAFAVLLLIPWGAAGRRQRVVRRFALLPAVVCISMLVSVVFEPDRSRDAVVVEDSQVLRAADSIGAPAALAKPLPSGTEVTLEERRQGWARISLADGTRGWLPEHSVETVERRAKETYKSPELSRAAR